MLGVPCLGRRYYVMQLCDAWTNVFASPGSRTTGTTERDFVIVGPHARDRLPRGVTPIRAPTDMVGLFGRTLIAGPDDYAEVHAIQAHYSLTPMSAIGGGHCVRSRASGWRRPSIPSRRRSSRSRACPRSRSSGAWPC